MKQENRDIARRAYKNELLEFKDRFPDDGRTHSEHMLAMFTDGLAKSDKYRKNNNLKKAYNFLANADDLLHKFCGYMEGEDVKKIAQAIADRSERLRNQAENNPYDARTEGYLRLAVDSKVLIQDLERWFHVKPRKPKKDLGTLTAILGIGLGLLFLSPNITGNVVGNASIGASNIVGALFFLVGIIGAWSWVRNR